MVAVIRRPFGIAHRANCYLVFRWVPSEVNYSDRVSRFYDADYDPTRCLLNRSCVLERQSMSSHSPHQAPSSSFVSTSPCHHMPARPVSSTGQGTAAQTPVSRAPPSTVSVIDPPSDATASFSGGQFSSGMLMSPKRRFGASSTTVACFRNHHQRLSAYVPAPAGITRHKFQQPYYRAPVLKPIPAKILSSQQNPLVSTKPAEILAEEAIRTVHAEGREEESEAVTEHGKSRQVVAPRPGDMSCRRRGGLFRGVGLVVSCSSSAMSACPLERSAFRSLATRNFTGKLSKRASLIFNDTNMAILH